MSGDEFQYYWWTNVARTEMASLITQMGLESCPTCGSNSSLNLLPWPALVHVGGSGAKPAGQHGGNFLYMALVRCESCGYSMCSIARSSQIRNSRRCGAVQARLPTKRC
jgi:hypothetical protein